MMFGSIKEIRVHSRLFDSLSELWGVGPQVFGPQGASGISAYDVWINQGNTNFGKTF